LWSLIRQLDAVPGDVLEVGVWRGGTAGLMGLGLREARLHARQLVLCDTFSGVVKTGAEDPHYRGGEHADTSEDVVHNLLSGLGIDQYSIHAGIFPDETGEALADRTFALCHIDVDAYLSAKDAFHWVWPRLSKGGCVVFDDYGFRGCEGVSRLGDELRALNEGLFIHNLNGQALLVKR
jgi:O-methyltransferase